MKKIIVEFQGIITPTLPSSIDGEEKKADFRMETRSPFHGLWCPKGT
jgi:hypothetical protein